MEPVPTRRSTLLQGACRFGILPGQQLENARLLSGLHVSAAAPESLRIGCRSHLCLSVPDRALLGRDRIGLGRIEKPGVYAVAAAGVGIGAQVRLIFRAQLQVAGLRDQQGLLVHRSEEHTSELQSLMRLSYAVFCL